MTNIIYSPFGVLPRTGTLPRPFLLLGDINDLHKSGERRQILLCIIYESYKLDPTDFFLEQYDKKSID